MTKILQLTPYPTRHPRQGGQLRAHHTARVLEDAGYTMDRMAVFSRSQYSTDGEDPAVDLDQARTERRFPNTWQVMDLTTNELAAVDKDCFRLFANRMQASNPEILMLEEPWLWPPVQRWRDSLPAPPPVIYNAYNIEYRAKAAILADAKVSGADGICAEVEALERELTRCAAGASATTAEDAATMQAWTEKRVVVARNGTVLRKVEHLYRVLPAPLEPSHRFLLFVGSAHPSNLTGFWDLVIPALSILRAGERIVVAGGVSHLVQSRIEKQGPFYMARDRLMLLDQVNDLTLDCLLCNAAGVLLPITYGGSNLKTAEALMSGLPIVGTTQAFRGFEEYTDLPAITTGDTPIAFAAGIRRIFNGKDSLEGKDSRKAKDSLKRLLWDNTLQPIVDLVSIIAAQVSESRSAAGCAAK
jgi:glycosyltransferase involved in cell wall biosynthesis